MPKAFEPAVLETARMRLRWHTPSDVDAMYAIYSDSQVSRYLSRPAFVEPAQAEKLVANVLAGYANGSSVNFAAERRDTGEVIADCSLFRFNEESRRAEIGYSLARPHWGRGYMHEALVAVVGYAFGSLGLNRLEADIDPRNTSSSKSLERLGFKLEGLLRERWIVAGETSDTAYYGLLRKEWILQRAT